MAGGGVAATGAVVAATGATVAVGSVVNIVKLASTVTGKTHSGQNTDQHGNKLGPSGKPQIDKVRHSTKKAAKDAARQEGKGAPVNHASPKKGESHYHATDKSGQKDKGSTHHEY